MTLGDVKLDLTGRGDFAARRACQGSLGNFGDNGEDFTMTVSAKLYLAEKQLHCVSQSPPAVILPAAAVSAVNSALASAHPTRHVGTDIGVLETAAIAAAAFAVLGSLLVAVFAIFVPIPLLGGILTVALSAIIGAIVGVSCHTSGDYDMTIRGLIPIMYRYDQFLDPNRSTSPYNPNSTYNHVLDALLSERGGANNIRAHARICGLAVPFVHETENHMLMTETSRYLTNQLLRNRAATYSMGPYPGPADNPDWDNNKNGMKKWLLEELQHFLRADFHEYNARPYERLSVMALQNLRDYALDPEVRLAACNVLDYLAAKYAVSSNELRRAAPFHRRDERGIYTPLYGNYSDEETWRFLFQIGNTDTLLRTRYGHIDPGAIGTMVVSATSTYSVPDVIADLIVDRANIQPYFQRFHHEGVEIYAGGPQYLLSAGGIYNSFYLIPEKSSPLPTTLMPTVDGADRMEFIRIDGNPNAPDRINTCLAPGFACGLNPVIPADIPTACLSTSGLWTFVNFASASGPCDRNYGLFVAMYRVDCTTDACKDAAGGAKTFGFFEVTDTRKPHDSFGAFKAMVLANNPSLQIQSEAVNIYKTTDLRSISFEPNTGDKWKSGIVRIDTATNPQVEPRDIQKWPLADGSRDPLTKQDLWIMKSAQDQNGNETGCVMIENRHMNQRLILDLSNVDEPKRSLVPISSPCRCPLTGDCRLQRCG
jgi:hypothetical protein